MPKKVVIEKHSKKKNHSDSEPKSSHTEKVLVDNFVALQKVMTNLAVKFDDLSNQLSKLLELFEISAKALAEKDVSSDRDKKENKKIVEKLDILAEQNKIIARGVSLMHDKFAEQPHEEMQRPVVQKPQFPTKPVNEQFPPNEKYYKSITED